MCIKKEYTCYKGKEDEDCCNARVREALRNRTYFYILILGIILMIIALVIKTSSNNVFVNQVSFASTITSIILSVIAIWMSITGERSTNEIKTKVTDSVDRLIKTSSEYDRLVADLSDMLSRQNDSYNSIKDQMESVLSEVLGVKSTIKFMGDSLLCLKENTTEKYPNNTFLVCKNIIDGIPNRKLSEELCENLVEIFQVKMQKQDIKGDEVYDMIKQTGRMKEIMYGIIVALAHNGFFADKNN